MTKSIKENTRTRIIQATLALIAEKGSDALRTREILERAEVTNLSAISYYFGSLENLRIQALERYFQGARPVIAGINEEEDPRKALLGYCQRMADFVLQNPSLERNIVSLAMSGDQATSIFTHIFADHIQALQRLILRGRGEANSGEALFDAIALVSATIYPLLLASYGPDTTGVDPLDENERDRYFSHLANLIFGTEK